MWTPVETQFYAKQNPIGIICIGDFEEAHTIRTFAEQLNLVVRFYRMGTPGDFLKVISREPELPPCIIICGHGDENGIVFGDYMEGIDTSMLKDESMPPESIEKHANLTDRIVVNTCCVGGTDAMASAFLKSNPRCYIGSLDYQNAASTSIFLTLFLDQLLRKNKPALEASRHFAFYDSNGRQKIE
ncbi:MAG: hypothetical protein J4F29_24520 [Candidatus Latescibacteria bacterium]|nr:hypothetical protein [Candidatus Latescibacterota bacterium]